jgi:hypothetical protein
MLFRIDEELPHKREISRISVFKPTNNTVRKHWIQISLESFQLSLAVGNVAVVLCLVLALVLDLEVGTSFYDP